MFFLGRQFKKPKRGLKSINKYRLKTGRHQHTSIPSNCLKKHNFIKDRKLPRQQFVLIAGLHERQDRKEDIQLNRSGVSKQRPESASTHLVRQCNTGKAFTPPLCSLFASHQIFAESSAAYRPNFPREVASWPKALYNQV